MSEAALLVWNSKDSIPADKVLKMTHLDLQKRFPKNHVYPKGLAALLCGSVLQKNGLAFLQELDEVGMTLVDWQRGNFHCELIQHPEIPLNRSYNLFHFAIPVFGQKVPKECSDPRLIFVLQQCRMLNSETSLTLPFL